MGSHLLKWCVDGSPYVAVHKNQRHLQNIYFTFETVDIIILLADFWAFHF